MPQVKHYTAKRSMTLDCGHAIQEGDAFQVTSMFSCAKEANWPWRILMACFQVMRQKKAASAQPQPTK